MRDGIIRRTIKAVARAWYMTEVRISRRLMRVRGEPPFELGGACRLCAKCCEAPAIAVGRATWRLRTVRGVYLWWQRVVNGFVLVDKHAPQRTFVFRCTHFDTTTRRCDSYESRPGMCRDYPRNLLYHPQPELLPGCGYIALGRNRERIAELLANEDIAPEKRAALEKVFYLEGDKPGGTAEVEQQAEKES